MPFVRRPLVLLIAALVAASPVSGADDEGEDVVERLPWHEDADTFFLRRIVEAATGRPIAGATVKLFSEVPHPEPGFGTPVAIGTSGPDGWARIERAALDAKSLEVYGDPSWVYVEAPGFAPQARMRPGGDVDWPLSPATTTRVRLVDPLDRPVANALVGLFLGCGHTPDARQATTGADGVALLERTGTGRGAGYLWTVAEGRRDPYAYQSDPGSAPWEPLKTVRLEWALTVEGTVLTHDGKPAVGVAVGLPCCHRGPWTHTDALGNFRLVGSEARVGGDVLVEFGEYPVGTTKSDAYLTASSRFPAPPPGHRAIVRLPEPGKEPVEERDDARLVVEADRTSWRKTTAESSITVYAVRTSDGWTTTAAVGEQGVALLDVRPGAYVVEALGRHPNGGIVHSRGRAEVVAPATGGAYVRVAMPAPALQPLLIEWPESEHGFDEVLVFADGATTRIRHLTEEDGVEDGNRVEVLLPPGEDAFVRFGPGGRPLRIDGATLQAAERAAAVRITPFARVEIRATFVDAAGESAPGWLFEGDPRDPVSTPERRSGYPSETPSVFVASGEHLTLVAWPADLTRFQPSFVDVPSAPAGATPVELGVVRLAPRSPALRLEDPKGKLRVSATVLVTRGDRADELSTGDDEWTGRVVDPWHAPGLLVEGALVRDGSWKERRGDAAHVFDVPYARRLEGPGPWTIRAPGGSLTIEVRGDGDAPIEAFTVHLDGRRCACDEKRLRLETLESGPHEVVVEAPGRTPRRLRFTLADGEQRTWIARLRPGASGTK